MHDYVQKSVQECLHENSDTFVSIFSPKSVPQFMNNYFTPEGSVKMKMEKYLIVRYQYGFLFGAWAFHGACELLYDAWQHWVTLTPSRLLLRRACSHFWSVIRKPAVSNLYHPFILIYTYASNKNLPPCRHLQWFPLCIHRSLWWSDRKEYTDHLENWPPKLERY